MTREVLAKLNDKQRKSVENYRNEYKREYERRYKEYAGLAAASSASKAYCKALADSGVVTEYEARVIFIYTTV